MDDFRIQGIAERNDPARVPRVLKRTSVILVFRIGRKTCNDSIVIVSASPAVNVNQKFKEYRLEILSKRGFSSNPKGINHKKLRKKSLRFHSLVSSI